MKKETQTTWYANIWIAGSFVVAQEACREFCKNVGLCVTVTPTTYVYTGGAEEGVCVRMIHYPRFPSDPESLSATAMSLAEHLKDRLHQDSFTVEFPSKTIWQSTRA